MNVSYLKGAQSSFLRTHVVDRFFRFPNILACRSIYCKCIQHGDDSHCSHVRKRGLQEKKILLRYPVNSIISAYVFLSCFHGAQSREVKLTALALELEKVNLLHHRTLLLNKNLNCNIKNKRKHRT